VRPDGAPQVNTASSGLLRWARMDRSPAPARPTARGLAAAAVGLVLFWLALRRAGVAETLEAVRRLGWGFLLVLALSGVREVSRTLAWMLSVDPPHRLRFRDAFPARLTGEALGNLTPLGLLVSEPAKAVCVRHRLPLSAGLSALAVETIFYSLTVVVVIVAGTLAMLHAFPVPEPLRIASVTGIALMVVTGTIVIWVIAARPTLIAGALQWLHGRGIARGFLAHRIDRMRALEERVYGFFLRHPRRLPPLCGLHAVFHLAGIAEVYVTLAFIADAASLTWLGAFVLEAVNRIVTVVFKFVPLRLGVDEAASGLVATVLRLGTTAGVALAIVRKARVLCWSAAGVALLVKRGLSVRQVMVETQVAVAADRP
jgi:hypothetical protein